MKNEKLKQFFSSKATRSVIVIAAVLLIGLAVYLNYRWFYDPVGSMGYGDNNMEDTLGNSQQAGSDEVEGAEKNYFTATAISRQQSRDEAIDVLKLVVENDLFKVCTVSECALSDALKGLGKNELSDHTALQKRKGSDGGYTVGDHNGG